MGYRVNAKDITTNYTQTLAEFTANLKYEDIPEDVRERAKHLAMQTIGVALGTKGMKLSNDAIAIGKSCGVGEPEATLWVDGGKVSMSSAVFTNSTLASRLGGLRLDGPSFRRRHPCVVGCRRGLPPLR